TPDSNVINKGVQQLSDTELNANQLQKDNLAKLKTALNGSITVKVPTNKVSEISKRITDISSLKEELGLDITSIVGSTFAVSAKGETDGTISISVIMNTLGASNPVSSIVTKDVKHISDAELNANIIQKNNLAKLKAALNGATTIKVPTDKASAISSRISDVASLKDELGIDLTSISGSTFKVSATGATDGTISISVTMTTAGATTPDSTALNKDVQQLSDTKLEANIIHLENKKIIIKKINKLNKVKISENKMEEIKEGNISVQNFEKIFGVNLQDIKNSKISINIHKIDNHKIEITTKLETPKSTLSPFTIKKNVKSSGKHSNTIIWISILSILSIIGTLGIILLIKKIIKK
ncbi:hypothetical protein, partial [Mycoplasma marinum]